MVISLKSQLIMKIKIKSAKKKMSLILPTKFVLSRFVLKRIAPSIDEATIKSIYKILKKWRKNNGQLVIADIQTKDENVTITL